MMDFTDLTGLASTIVLLITPFSILFLFLRYSKLTRLILLVLYTGLLLIPFGPVSAAFYVRSFVGDLSITTLVFFFLITSGALFNASPAQKKEVELFCVLLFPIVLIFYPLALGLTMYDPYILGYGSPYLLGFIFLGTLLAWFRHQWLIAVSLSLSIFCYAIGWYESNNLWDYLIDPLLAVYTLVVLINLCLLRLWRYLLRCNFQFRHPIQIQSISKRKKCVDDNPLETNQIL
jgi:hypothetical protein